MSYRIRSYLATLTVLSSVFAFSSTTFDPQKLEYKAEIEGYGYKTSNLTMIDGLLSDAALSKSLGAYRAQVPDFIGLTSSEVQSILKLGGLNLLSRWHFISSAKLDAMSKIEAFSTKTLPQDVIDDANKLADDIESTLTNLRLSPSSAKLQAFLKKAQDHKWRLMVRSTGKEDTKKLANAGGNHSEGNVSPDMQNVLPAIGRVIASYFREKSLMQRLSAGDQSLFDIPLTPVLIQRMIGEPAGGVKDFKDIPTGCVAYTEEPSAKVKEILVLQCSFGHNAGVVDSLVALDSFYVTPDNAIQSIVKVKPKRIVPIVDKEVFGLGEKENVKGIQKQASLSKDAILAIAKVSRAIDGFYNDRMDIELAYDPASKTIFIVQARPLVYPQEKEEPSYIAHDGQFKQVISATTIYPKDSAVQKITNKASLLRAETLEQALHTYNTPKFNKFEVVAVVAAKRADATSHAAATFRGEGKMILVVKEFEKLKKWMDASKVDLLLDAQQGLIVNLANEKLAGRSFDDLVKKRIIQWGWINYPLPLVVSAGAHQESICIQPKPDLSLSGKIRCLNDRLDDEVDELSHFTEEMREKANCNILDKKCVQEHLIAQMTLPLLEKLNTHAHAAQKQIESAPAKGASELLNLFPKRFLDALVSQDPSREVSDAYSYRSVKEQYEDRREFVQQRLMPKIASKQLSEIVIKDSDVFLIIESGVRASLTDRVGNDWIHFVNAVISKGSDLEKQHLYLFSKALSELEILPLWINSHFAQNAKECVSSEKQCWPSSTRRLKNMSVPARIWKNCKSKPLKAMI